MQYIPSPTKGSGVGAIIGGVVAVLVLTVIVIALIVVLCMTRKRSKMQVNGQINQFHMEGE